MLVEKILLRLKIRGSYETKERKKAAEEDKKCGSEQKILRHCFAYSYVDARPIRHAKIFKTPENKHSIGQLVQNSRNSSTQR